MEGAAGDRQAAGLLGEGLHQRRMAVAEADRRVGGHHVEVPPALLVEQPHAVAAREHDRQRVVVAGAVAVFEGDGTGDRGTPGVKRGSASGSGHDGFLRA